MLNASLGDHMCKLSRFQNLYESQYKPLLSYAMSVLHDHEQCEEIVQDVFLIAWQKVDAVLDSPNPCGWLMNTLKFTLKNYNKKVIRNYFEYIPLDEAIYLSDTSKNIEDSVCDQPIEETWGKQLRQREIYILERVVIEGYSCKEVAKMLGIKDATCQKQYLRALNKIRKALPRDQ